MIQRRIEWVDSLKFLGIFAIYLGHLGHQAGNAYEFVFRYHVALFFFCAGFFTKNIIHTPVIKFVSAKTLKILVPYYIFSFIFILLLSVNESWNADKLIKGFYSILSGIRNDQYVGSLWFLNCIYVTFLLDYLFVRILRNKFFVLAASAFALIYTQVFMTHNPRIEPSWFWNIDSALSFWFFMAAGRVMFKKLDESALMNISSKKSIIPFILSAVVAALYFYVGPDWIFKLLKIKFSDTGFFKFFFYISYSTAGSLILIIFNIFIAKKMATSKFISNIGSNTLSICGLENSVKLIFPIVFSTIGVSIKLTTPMSAFLYAFSCLILANFLSKILKKYAPIK